VSPTTALQKLSPSLRTKSSPRDCVHHNHLTYPHQTSSYGAFSKAVCMEVGREHCRTCETTSRVRFKRSHRSPSIVCKHVWKAKVDTFSTCCDGHVFNMKQGTCVINFMLLNILVGKLYRHFCIRKLVGHSVVRKRSTTHSTLFPYVFYTYQSIAIHWACIISFRDILILLCKVPYGTVLTVTQAHAIHIITLFTLTLHEATIQLDHLPQQWVLWLQTVFWNHIQRHYLQSTANLQWTSSAVLLRILQRKYNIAISGIRWVNRTELSRIKAAWIFSTHTP
jgi:hypothetical protein